jgi:hypothetical protein
MEISGKVWDLVNNRADTRGLLATADQECNCDVACFSSLRLADRTTMTVTLSPNRSLENLRVNPKAAFVVTTGESIGDVDGCRVYLRVRDLVGKGRCSTKRGGKSQSRWVKKRPNTCRPSLPSMSLRPAQLSMWESVSEGA